MNKEKPHGKSVSDLTVVLFFSLGLLIIAIMIMKLIIDGITAFTRLIQENEDVKYIFCLISIIIICGILAYLLESHSESDQQSPRLSSRSQKETEAHDAYMKKRYIQTGIGGAHYRPSNPPQHSFSDLPIGTCGSEGCGNHGPLFGTDYGNGHCDSCD